MGKTGHGSNDFFSNAILNKKEINIFNNGNMFRDFTYIDDVVNAIEACCYKPAEKNKGFDFLNPDASSSFCSSYDI